MAKPTTLTFKNYIKSISGGDGSFSSVAMIGPYQVETEDGKITYYPPDSKKECKLYIKGLRKLIKEAKYKGFFEGVGEQYTGNKNDVWSKFEKLEGCASTSQIQELGENRDARPVVTSYVDGSYSWHIA